MSYENQKRLLDCFNNNKKHQGSIKSFFKDFLGSDLGKTKYSIEKEVNKVFYVDGSGGSQRSLLTADENDLLQRSVVKEFELDDDQPTIALLNDYIAGLNLKRELGRMKLLTLLSIFLVRRFRHKYYKLKINNDKYSNLLKDAYFSLMKAKPTILRDLKSELVTYIEGDGTFKYKPIAKSSSKYLANRFMFSDLILDANNLSESSKVEEEDELDEDVEVKSAQFKDAIDELGYKLLFYRTERVVKKENFPYLNSKQLKLMHEIVKDYRSIYLKFNSKVNSSLINLALKVADSTVNKYKPIVASELSCLANRETYDDITMYLLDSED